MTAAITHLLALWVGAAIGFAFCAWLSANDETDDRHFRGRDDRGA